MYLLCLLYEEFGLVTPERMLGRVSEAESRASPLLLFVVALGRQLSSEQKVAKQEGEEEYYIDVAMPLTGMICRLSRLYEGNV